MKVIYLSEYTYKWHGGLFDPLNDTIRNFRAFVRFFCLIFRNSLLDLLITGFTVIENDLFCGGENRKQKITGTILGFYGQNGDVT